MKKTFKITEILSKFITIDNNNPTIEDVENKYKNQEIVLDAEDFDEVIFTDISKVIFILDESKIKEILNLLKYSWKDIDYKYINLTDKEKECISEKTFNYIINNYEKDI